MSVADVRSRLQMQEIIRELFNEKLQVSTTLRADQLKNTEQAVLLTWEDPDTSEMDNKVNTVYVYGPDAHEATEFYVTEHLQTREISPPKRVEIDQLKSPRSSDDRVYETRDGQRVSTR